jgi:hypothetical protein
MEVDQINAILGAEYADELRALFARADRHRHAAGWGAVSIAIKMGLNDRARAIVAIFEQEGAK